MRINDEQIADIHQFKRHKVNALQQFQTTVNVLPDSLAA